MNLFFPLLLILAMAATLFSLFSGLFLMTRGRPQDARTANRFMRWRVILQGVALALFALAFLAR